MIREKRGDFTDHLLIGPLQGEAPPTPRNILTLKSVLGVSALIFIAVSLGLNYILGASTQNISQELHRILNHSHYLASSNK